MYPLLSSRQHDPLQLIALLHCPWPLPYFTSQFPPASLCLALLPAAFSNPSGPQWILDTVCSQTPGKQLHRLHYRCPTLPLGSALPYGLSTTYHFVPPCRTETTLRLGLLHILLLMESSKPHRLDSPNTTCQSSRLLYSAGL